MKVPARYRYDPRWQLVALLWTCTAGFPIVVLTGYFPRALGIAASLLFAGLGVLIMLRRYAFPRSLVLDQEGVWIPSGFMRMNVRRVLFARDFRRLGSVSSIQNGGSLPSLSRQNL